MKINDFRTNKKLVAGFTVTAVLSALIGAVVTASVIESEETQAVGEFSESPEDTQIGAPPSVPIFSQPRVPPPPTTTTTTTTPPPPPPPPPPDILFTAYTKSTYGSGNPVASYEGVTRPNSEVRASSPYGSTVTTADGAGRWKIDLGFAGFPPGGTWRVELSGGGTNVAFPFTHTLPQPPPPAPVPEPQG